MSGAAADGLPGISLLSPSALAKSPLTPGFKRNETSLIFDSGGLTVAFTVSLVVVGSISLGRSMI